MFAPGGPKNVVVALDEHMLCPHTIMHKKCQELWLYRDIDVQGKKNNLKDGRSL